MKGNLQICTAVRRRFLANANGGHQLDWIVGITITTFREVNWWPSCSYFLMTIIRNTDKARIQVSPPP